ncbi:PH domain-containing protein [Niallia sp.]|uniref:PH domain-containing protein n=1 Tax=Niallia sp. TaxID=2837523 RepID=UPI0028A003A2|nr:PH domain-containing protein [Niallia sp.]
MKGVKKRQHPIKIVFDIVGFIKSHFFLFIILFVTHFGSEKMYMKVFQFLFLTYAVWQLLSFLVQWFMNTYTVEEEVLHIKSGIFTKSERVIPFYKVQNIHRHTSFFHKGLQLTSLTLETGETGDSSSIQLAVIRKKEADWLETYISQLENDSFMNGEEARIAVGKDRTIHFRATKRDLVKASFTSLSFLALVPLLFSFFSHIESVFKMEVETNEVLTYILRHVWVISGVIIVLISLAMLFGIGRTFWKYGRFEITSDKDKIYIKKGLISETSFSIQKEKVQAVKIIQYPIQRLLKIAEVKLVSTGDIGNEEMEVNSLFPYLPVEQAYEIIEELLPTYHLKRHMKKLPRKALYARMIRPSYFGIIATIGLLYWKPTLWYMAVLLFIWIYLLRVLDYLNSSYIQNESFIQVKKGSLQSTLILTKRAKIMEIKVQRSRLQKHFGLASIDFINRSQPIEQTDISDIPASDASDFYHWYNRRMYDIQIETHLQNIDNDENGKKTLK